MSVSFSPISLAILIMHWFIDGWLYLENIINYPRLLFVEYEMPVKPAIKEPLSQNIFVWLRILEVLFNAFPCFPRMATRSNKGIELKCSIANIAVCNTFGIELTSTMPLRKWVASYLFYLLFSSEKTILDIGKLTYKLWWTDFRCWRNDYMHWWTDKLAKLAFQSCFPQRGAEFLWQANIPPLWKR